MLDTHAGRLARLPVLLLYAVTMSEHIPPEPKACRHFMSHRTSSAKLGWQKARAAAELPPLINISDEATKVMSNFYRFLAYTPRECIPSDNSSGMVYQPIWKAGNEFVRAQLDLGCASQKKAGMSDQYWSRLFTFVREPLSHFVSGYIEAARAAHDWCCNGRGNLTNYSHAVPPEVRSRCANSKGTWRLCQLARDSDADVFAARAREVAETYIFELLDAKQLEPVQLFYHLFPMVGAVYPHYPHPCTDMYTGTE